MAEAADTGTHRQFYDYYARESANPATLQRFHNQKEILLGLHGHADGAVLRIADLGCGAGTGTAIWAQDGHAAFGLDINRPLVELAAGRARAQGLPARFAVGSAEQLPWPDASFDICLAPELLEHVPDWRQCVAEIARVLKPGGVVFFSTTNTLCPRQHEFRLPGYSWYPAPLKRRYEHQARSTRPELANYATYPAVNWFNFYNLRRSLRQYGFAEAWDRFDMARVRLPAGRKRALLSVICATPIGRFAGYCATNGTQIVARKA